MKKVRNLNLERIELLGFRTNFKILELTAFEANHDLLAGFEAVQEWIDGKVNDHKARNIAFSNLYKEVRERKGLIKKKFVKTMAHIVCIPHVKDHGLWSSDTAITLTDEIYPNDLSKVKEKAKSSCKVDRLNSNL